MKTYLTLIQIAGLRRADPIRARVPIGEGEVIKLPDGYARSLLDSGAIEPSDADETIELFWDQPVELIKSNDVEGLKKALEIVGIDFASGPDQSAVNIIGIAPTDVQALAQALEAQGALVVLSGEQLAGKDHARLAQLMQDQGSDPLCLVHTPELLGELAKRISEGEVDSSELPEEVLGFVAAALSGQANTIASEINPELVAEARETIAASALEDVPPSAPPPSAPPKPPRKRA